MEAEVKKFKELIENSEKILITSHTSPDPDAVSSVLLMGLSLMNNFPDKQVSIVLEEEPLGLDSIPGYERIEFIEINTALTEKTLDLLIMLDANNFSRITRRGADDLERLVKEKGIKTAIIDHHQPAGRYAADVYINQESPATAQDVYELCFERLRLQKPADYAQLAMLGIYSDSGGFAYQNKRHSDTLRLVDGLITNGANIEKVVNLTNQYTVTDMLVFAELARNVNHEKDYTFSFLTDKFVSEWLASGKTGAQLHKGTEGFVNDFIRNIEGRLWGFIVYRNILAGDGIYSASFRSVGDSKDVSNIAIRLGGGGHKPAAGARFGASSVENAINKVRSAINST